MNQSIDLSDGNSVLRRIRISLIKKRDPPQAMKIPIILNNPKQPREHEHINTRDNP